MTHIPDAVFIIDTHLEDLAVREAIATKVKTVGITDTGMPTRRLFDYPIPANDDAVGSVQLIVAHIIDAWIEGRSAQQNAEGGEVKGTKETKAPVKRIKRLRRSSKLPKMSMTKWKNS